MKELEIDIRELWKNKKWTCITTNGYVTTSGKCVMGRGVALEAKNRYSNLPTQLGSAIKKYNNRVFVFPDYKIITFPVKHFWYETADIELIKKSFNELKNILNSPLFNIKEIYLPRPGCSNGKLKWSEVKKELEPIYDDRIIFINKKKEKNENS